MSGIPSQSAAKRKCVHLIFSMLAVACKATVQPEPIDLRVSVEPIPIAGPAGGPVVLRYGFEAGPRFRPRAWSVFVHILASDGATVVNDDHVPLPAPAAWKPNGHYEYSRVIFTPRQFPGRLEVRLGLFDPISGRRTRLATQHIGRGEHRVAFITTTRAGGAPVFGDGFYGPEGDAALPFVSRRWMASRGVVSLPNPRVDALLVLKLWTTTPPAVAPGILQVRVGGVSAVYPLEQRPWQLVCVRVARTELGDGDWTDVDLSANREFRGLADSRPLAVAVENVALLPLSADAVRLIQPM